MLFYGMDYSENSFRDRRGGIPMPPILAHGDAPATAIFAFECAPQEHGIFSENNKEFTMTRAVIIGGSGHVGTYLVPRLVETGYEVIAVSRGQRDPYQPHGAWQAVQQVTIDRMV